MGEVFDLVALLSLHADREARGQPRLPVRRATPVAHEDVASHRNVGCSAYDACLDEVLARGWPNWSCECCTLFRSRSAARQARQPALAAVVPLRPAGYPID